MSRPRLLAALSACVLVMTGCAKAKAPQTQGAARAANVIAVAGTNRVQIQLTPAAVKRLAIQTAAVRVAPVAPRHAGPEAALTPRLVIPFAAVMYLPTGEAFTYVVAGPQLYERVAMVIDYVAGDLAVLSSGPTAGTSVVVAGGPELTGVQFGTGE